MRNDPDGLQRPGVIRRLAPAAMVLLLTSTFARFGCAHRIQSPAHIALPESALRSRP
jgi:hypothetical protein